MTFNQRSPYATAPGFHHNKRDPAHGSPYPDEQGGNTTAYGMNYNTGERRKPQMYQDMYGLQDDHTRRDQSQYNGQQQLNYAHYSAHGVSESKRNGYETARRGTSPGERQAQTPRLQYASREQDHGSNEYGHSNDEYQAPNKASQMRQTGQLGVNNVSYGREKSYPEPGPTPSSRYHDRQAKDPYIQPDPTHNYQFAQANGSFQGDSYNAHDGNKSPAQYAATAGAQSRSLAGLYSPIDKRTKGDPLTSRPKRILKDVKSPETLSWDNPFPAFPTKPKKGPHTEANSPPTSTARSDQDDATLQTKMFERRPQTARSKSSHSSSHHSKDSVFERYSDDKTGFKAPESTREPSNQPSGYVEQYSESPRDPYVMNNQVRESPKTREDWHSRSHVAQSRTSPHLQIFQSGDKHVRPSMPLENSPSSGYERSRTMPAAVSGLIVDSGLIPAEDHASWQVPGSVSGYFGPEDKDFLPTEQANRPQQRPQAVPRSKSDDGRWGKQNGGHPLPNSLPHQLYAQGVGENTASRYDEPPKQYQPYQRSNGHDRLSPADEEMPNFDTAGLADGYRRGMTIDDHLQPEIKRHEKMLAMPAHNYSHEQRYYHVDEYADSPPARSRSQPDLQDSRQPRAQLVQGFNFGVPVPPENRPATSGGPRMNDGRTRVTTPKDPWHAQDPRSGVQNGPGSTNVSGSHLQDRRRGPDSRRTDHKPSKPDRHRSPPLHNGGPQNDRMRQLDSRTPPLSSKGPIPPTKALQNPDALPHHPAPIRPGFADGAQSTHAPRPPPLRQYNGAPDPVRQPGKSHLIEEQRESGPVTYKDLEVLRQKALRSPNDQAAQLLLAKTLVEAAGVLIDERADPSAKKRNRDKYHSDALKIIKKLSASGYPEADFYYGDCISRGVLGLQPDIKEAFTLYQKAAKANHAQAAYRVAVCCEIGQEEGGGTKRDPVKAMQWYKRAATLGDAAAMYKMGVIQLKGLLNQPKDSRNAVTWLRRAAERADKENPHALHELALLHEKPTNVEGVRQDEALSRQLFNRAADLGYKFSQFRLGCAYEYGLLGCHVDPRQSIAWYSKAAVQEEHQSELALSGWYLTGSEGVLQQSDTEAYLWARKAAQAGLAKAEYAMGYFTEVGIGAPANLEDAKRWYWRSASQNFPKARDRLEDLRKGGATKQKARVSRSNMKKQSDGECIIM